MLLDDVREGGGADAVARAMLEALEAPVGVRDELLAVHASIGVAVASGGESADQLLAHADVAMSAAKATGKHGFRRHDPALAAGRVPCPPPRAPFLAGVDTAAAPAPTGAASPSRTR